MTNEDAIKYLKFLTKTYSTVTDAIKVSKQRLLAFSDEGFDYQYDSFLKGQKHEDGLETVKGRITREIEKELNKWDIWELWLKGVPGIGPAIASQLIMLYYYRFDPICKDCGGDLQKNDGALICCDCGKKAKDGMLKYKVGFKDFQTISKWWAYMGRNVVDGAMPKRKKGALVNWSPVGRELGFQISDQFNRHKDKTMYGKFLLDRKEKHVKNNDSRDEPWSKGHILNAAKNEAVKLFLSHFWVVARTLDGKSVSQPYASTIMGHTNIIDPFYFDMDEYVRKVA